MRLICRRLTMSLSGRAQAHPLTQEFHGPLQARVRRHPTNGTVRVRRCLGKRRQHSLQLSAPRPQPKRAWGSDLASTSRQRTRRAPRRQAKLPSAARARRLPQTKTPAGRFESVAASSPQSQTKSDP
jgi:hypothetical protein